MGRADLTCVIFFLNTLFFIACGISVFVCLYKMPISDNRGTMYSLCAMRAPSQIACVTVLSCPAQWHRNDISGHRGQVSPREGFGIHPAWGLYDHARPLISGHGKWRSCLRRGERRCQSEEARPGLRRFGRPGSQACERALFPGSRRRCTEACKGWVGLPAFQSASGSGCFAHWQASPSCTRGATLFALWGQPRGKMQN